MTRLDLVLIGVVAVALAALGVRACTEETFIPPGDTGAVVAEAR